MDKVFFVNNDIERNLSGFIKLIQEGNSLIITQANEPIVINQSLKKASSYWSMCR